MESHAVGHRGKRLRSPSYPGLIRARMDSEKSPRSCGSAKSEAVKGGVPRSSSLPTMLLARLDLAITASQPSRRVPGGRLCAPPFGSCFRCTRVNNEPCFTAKAHQISKNKNI